jgi:alpha-galactosidase
MPVILRENYWILETAHAAYAFGLTPRGLLAHAYWGARLPFADDYPAVADGANWASFTHGDHLTPEEYPAYAGAKYIEPCLKATFRPTACATRCFSLSPRRSPPGTPCG